MVRSLLLLSTFACVLACFSLFAGVPCMASPDPEPPSWASFEPASFLDVFLTPSLATNVFDYSLALGPDAEIVLGATTYDVNWVQAYFVVSQDEVTDFTATNGTTVTDWRWESKSLPGRISGWMGDGTSRLYPGNGKDLGFGSFDITGNAVLSGLHVAYQVGPTEETGFYKGELPVIPEPAGLLTLVCGLGGVGGMMWRRRK